MDEEIQSPILTIPGISYRMGAMIIAEIGDFSRFDSQIRYSHMQECLPPPTNQDNLITVIPIWKNVVHDTLRYALYNATKYVCHWDNLWRIS